MSDEATVDAWREYHGWFGPPWPSGVCFDDDGRLKTEERRDFPAGEACFWCDVPLDEAAGDSGTAMPLAGQRGTGVIFTHKECMLRSVVGSLAHLEGRCSCHDCGADADEWPGDMRAEALAVWDWVQSHGISRAADA